MNAKRGGFIDVDKHQQQLASEGNVLQRVAEFYGRTLPELHRVRNETRMACEFNCGKQEPTGDRVMAVREEEDGCVFNCFQYGCTTRGNLLSLMWMMKHNEPPAGGRLKGREFSEIAGDLQNLVDGKSPAPTVVGREPASTEKTNIEGDSPTPNVVESQPKPPAKPIVKTERNIPLKDSENERARELVTLDERFVRDIAEMSPEASQYVRSRPYLTPETMEKFRCGYLPSSGGSLLRGHFVYPWLDEQGDVLTWFGRNVKYEQQHQKWRKSGDSTKEPQKFRFVKGFLRGQEIFNEQNVCESENVGLLKETGVIAVEGPNDAIALNTIGVPATAICSNKLAEQQAKKLAKLAAELGDGTVTVMFDLDQFGISGADQAVAMLARETRVRLGWNTGMADGRFLHRQAESITEHEWQQTILPHLTK